MKKTLLFISLCLGYLASTAQISSTVTVQSNVTCFGQCNGAANITASGGTMPYTYTLIPNNTTGMFTSMGSLSNLCAGAYTVIVADASMTTTTSAFSITQPSPLSMFVNSNNACGGTCNGFGYISVTGGTSPYSYQWSNGANFPQVNNLCPGVYTVQVTDVNGCIVTNTTAVNQSPAINIAVTQTNATCNSNCNGAVDINVSGGTPAYTYYWSPSGVTTPSLSNLCPGTYSFSVSDAMGCSEFTVVSITSAGTIPNASLTITPYDETCYLSGDGAIDLTLTGSNTGPFTYSWSNGASTQDLTGISSNNYWVTVTDGGSNCVSLYTTISSTGLNCGTISGNVFQDMNSDCIKNIGESNAVSVSVIVNPGARWGYTNTNGDYIINNLPYDTYSVSLNSYYGNFIPTCTTTITANINGGTPNSINNNLSVGFNSATNPDMRTSGYSIGIVPGFVCRMNYNFSNLNNVNGTGLFKVTLPPAFIPNITTVSPGTYTISGDTIIWNFSNVIYSNGYTPLYIDFTVPISTPLGSIFTSCMYVQPNIADFNPANNTFCYSRMVTGSFDPNDKTPSPVGVGPNGDIAASITDLTYLIRFQNTGNGPAVNIMVSDTLSPNVNPNTFEMLSASHNYVLDILPGNVLRWKFNNIMLVDSGANEPASHGYIQYRIKRTATNTPGTQIKNTAYIYFDFNEPVITNTAINTIETITGIHSKSANDSGWELYPNPSNGALYIVNSSIVKEAGQIQVLNSIGQTVLEENINGNYKNIDLSKLNNGVYFVKITSDKNTSVKRIVLSK